MSKVENANDNSKRLTVVWEDGARVRNYVMRRLVPDISPDPEGTTGEVDFGKEGKWIGFAMFNSEKNKWMFTRVRELKQAKSNVG